MVTSSETYKIQRLWEKVDHPTFHSQEIRETTVPDTVKSHTMAAEQTDASAASAKGWFHLTRLEPAPTSCFPGKWHRKHLQDLQRC